MSSNNSNDVVRDAGMLSHPHGPKGKKGPPKPKSGKTDKEKSSETELFDEERKLFCLNAPRNL